MRAKTLRRALLAVPLFLFATGALQAQRTVASNDDHPLLRHAAGSKIAHKEVQEDHTCDLPTGPAQGSRFSSTREFRGRATSITYTQQQGRSIGDVYRELQEQLQASGMQVLFSCKDGKCGTGTGPANFCIPAWRGSNGQRQLTGTIQRPGGYSVVSLHVQAPDTRERAVAHVTVVEVSNRTGTAVGAGVRPGTPVANATATFSSATLLRTGQVALAEPLFQPKSAHLRPEANQVLADIALFLKQNPGVQVIVANGTDAGAGILASLLLSRDRAGAVVTALTSRYGVAANRVKAQGNGRVNMDNVAGDSQTLLLLDR